MASPTTVVLDDRLLVEELLRGLPKGRRRVSLYTTAYWYYRACRAAAAGAGGHLSGPFAELPADVQTRAVLSLLELRDDIALPDPRVTVPVMADLAGVHPKLNSLNLEATATARVLGATVWLSEPSAAGVLPAVLDAERVMENNRHLVTERRHVSTEERAARGKAARAVVPRGSHGGWCASSDRVSPVDLLEEQAKSRVAEIVPIRHGRMLLSPFSYFRGAALPMAADLGATASSGITVQACGDAHLSNFGMFASPERHLFFDVNDFDETAPAPWEWDVKRLAASLEIAGRDHDFSAKRRRTIVQSSVRSYREAMRGFADQSMLDVWYARLDMDELMPRFQALLDPTRTPSVWSAVTKARAHDSHQAFDKLCHVVEGEPRIAHDPPLIVPVAHVVSGVDESIITVVLDTIVTSYRQTLDRDRQQLLDQYRLVDVARKVVGVGSVGTDAWIALFIDRGTHAPLFLQIKQAEPSVLERFTATSEFANHGQRVVAGQRLMQAASDIFLGWERFSRDGNERDYYFRQLRDWKGSADIAGMTAAGMALWAEMCGWTLARAHARSGDRVAIASYLGTSDAFDRAIASFADKYADQSERDYRALQDAVTSNRLTATLGI